ncbi:VIT domain-containing protein [Chitinophaga defluvii]|uniref:VIT domain-containing protein n=1 Tax=Chitinophaga defluvii TaxID=3163343 RepID=A0ABV2SYT3_9BACT
MIRFIHSSVLLLLLLVGGTNSMAQLPRLKSTDTGGKEDKQAVKLQSLDIDVQVTGTIATTVMTMTFHNASHRVLEGELTFPLPEGASVSRYALDINGRLREAVPVEKAKATEVFESIERRRVDPGMLEKVEGNNFRTRIYPLPAGGNRTILVAYEEELKPDGQQALRYHLPLAYNTAIPSFKLKTTVFESVEKPELTEQPDGSFSFRNNGRNYMATMHKTNYQPDKSLTINLPKTSDMPEALMQAAGDSYYFLINAYPQAQHRPRKWANRIGIIWDASLSSLHRDTKKELALLDKIITQQQNLTIELGILNTRFVKAGTFTITNGNWQALKTALENITYDGGTNFSTISNRVLNAEEYLFFTDGLSTFGKDQITLQKPVHCINTAAKADYSVLKFISMQTGGQFINLNNTSLEQAAKQLGQQSLQFLGIKSNRQLSEVYPSLPVVVNGHVSVAGIVASADAPVTLQFGYAPREVVMEKTVQLKADKNQTAINISRVWAQKKIAEMDIQYEKHKEDISLLGKQFGIVTRNTSLIVLETVADYVRYDITPPEELLPEYNQLRKEALAEKEERVNDLLDRARNKATELNTWWSQVFTPRKIYPQPNKPGAPVPVQYTDSTAPAILYSESAAASPVANYAPPAAADRRMEREMALGASESKLADVVVVGNAGSALQSRAAGVVVQPAARRKAGRDDMADNSIAQRPSAIETPVFKSDNAYMKKLTDVSPAEAYKTYLRIREEYISTPLFYYDIASWFYQQKRPDTALLILSNIADLELENAALFKLLAYKLKEAGAFDEAVFITKKVLDWRPMDAQSYRDYALALADCGNYQLALDTLYSVLTQSYTQAAAARDHGIEEIIITEINNLISRHKHKVNTSRIDKALIRPMPVDVRVVLNWNKNDTDIDLWVTDPNGEKCFYNNKTTSAGGRISQDITQGFGPEQFMLKKASKGKYKIAVNYYGDTQVSITGPTTVMAEIYTNYSNGTEERKVITLQMPKAGKEGVLIGTFSF